jgi:hypothetical protein
MSIWGMYENLVVVEALKAAHNRGIEPLLSFYRDKSASTFTAEMLKSLERFAALGASPPGGSVIYSGPSQQPVRGIEIRNHTEVGELLFADA